MTDSIAVILVKKASTCSSTKHVHLLARILIFQEMNQDTCFVISLAVIIISSGIINVILHVLHHLLQLFQEVVNISVTLDVLLIKHFTSTEHVWMLATHHLNTEDNGTEISAIILVLQIGSFTGIVLA